MANTIKLRRSATPGAIPTTSQIAIGELALNSADGALYLKRSTDGAETGGTTSIIKVYTASGGAISGDVTLNAQADLRFADSDSSNWVAFQGASTISSNVTWTLPSVDGTSGQVLSTNGTGTLSWATASDGSTTNASDLTSGTLADARLSAKVLAAVNTTLWSNFR